MIDAPPSVKITWPVIHPASSEQRNATIFPTSAGVPSRPIALRVFPQSILIESPRRIVPACTTLP